MYCLQGLMMRQANTLILLALDKPLFSGGVLFSKQLRVLDCDR